MNNRRKKSKDSLREIKGEELEKEERATRASVEASGVAMVVAWQL